MKILDICWSKIILSACLRCGDKGKVKNEFEIMKKRKSSQKPYMSFESLQSRDLTGKTFAENPEFESIRFKKSAMGQKPSVVLHIKAASRDCR